MKLWFVCCLFLVLALTGCVINEEVKPNEAGVLVIGGRIDGCRPPGLVTNLSFFSDLKKVKGDTLTFGFGNASVATYDTQIVTVGVTVQARRKTDCESATGFLTKWTQLLDDTRLQETISNTGSEAIKNGVRQFTLTQLLDDRNGLATAITTALQEDASEYFTEIINVVVNDVDVDDEYEKLLSDKAKLTVQIETELRRQDLVKQTAQTNALEQEQQVRVLQAQLEREKAQTAVQVEISSRASKATLASWQVYLDNPEALALRRLELYKDIFGQNAKWVFLPPGTSVDSILTEELIPVVQP